MDGSPPPKRRKTLLACEHCRSKKIKCDGNRPVCGTCAKKDWGEDECVWRHVDGREESVSEALIQDLQKRIQQLEKQAGSNPLPVTLQATRPVHGPVGNPVDAAPNSWQSTDATEPGPGVSAIEGAVTGEPQNEGYIGSSSAAAFMNLIRRVVDPQSKLSLPVNSLLHPPDLAGHTAANTRNTHSESYVLPPRKIADALVDTYWKYVHPLYPFLNKRSFGCIYNSLWTGAAVSESPSPLMRTSEANSVCVVNMVLALGCQYHDTSNHSEGCHEAPKTAEVFFTRARAVFQYDPVESTDQSLQLVQAILLMAQYLKSIGSTHKAWGIMGLAIRTCQRLGLHLPATSSEDMLPDPVDRELVRRVYQGCLMEERMLCMTLGRPVSTSEMASVLLPSGIDEDSYHAAKLYDIVQHIILAFYSDDRSNALSDYDQYFTGPNSVFEIDSKMTRWYASIPQHIQLKYSKQVALGGHAVHMTFQRQAVVLQLRYLHARISLLRPILSKCCTSGRDRMPETIPKNEAASGRSATLGERTASQCSLLCVKSAIELIEVTNDHLTTAEAWGKKPSWLYGVLHVYLAATVLLAARLSPCVLLGEIPDADIQASWQHALQILRSFQSDSVSAQRCVAALEILYQKLPGNKQEQGPIYIQSTGLTPHLAAPDQWNGQISQFPALNGGNDQTGTEISGGLQPDTSQWFVDFDLSDPYDMSWFQIAPELDFA